jgi:hypothetical protein
MLMEQGLPGSEVDAVGAGAGLVPGAPDEVMQDPRDGREIVEDM